MRTITFQQIVGHLAYVWPFIKSPWFLLYPLYHAIDSGLVPHEAVRHAHEAWVASLKCINLCLPRIEPEIIFTDATQTQLGLVHHQTHSSVILKFILPIYHAEFMGILYAMYYALHEGIIDVHIVTDNMAALYICRKFRGYRLPPIYMFALYYTASLFDRITFS